MSFQTVPAATTADPGGHLLPPLRDKCLKIFMPVYLYLGSFICFGRLTAESCFPNICDRGDDCTAATAKLTRI